jgi:hypothetical protein
MPLTPIPGVTRLRRLQLGLENTFKTQVPATRRMPWSFAPTINPNLTFPTADTGTLSQAIAPYRTGLDLTGVATGQLFGNDIPYLMSMLVKGGVTVAGGGSAKTWGPYTPAETSQDVFDTWTGEFGDDATGDAWALVGGVAEKCVFTYPQNQGPIDISADLRFAAIGAYPDTYTGGLNVDLAPVPMFMADTSFYINDSSGTIETTKLSDVAYDATLTYTNNLDIKRFANGSNTRFEVQNYGRGERVIELMINGAKQTSWIAESLKWIAASPTERFFGIKTQSVVDAQAGTKYSLDFRLPGYWITRAETTVTTNTAFSLTAHQVYDSGLGYAFTTTAVNTLSAF